MESVIFVYLMVDNRIEGDMITCMGMYDTIIIKMDTGFVPDIRNEYQTKDLDNSLWYFEIRDDGTLWRTDEFTDDAEPKQYKITDYLWSIGQDKDGNYFDLNMWFKDGVVMSFDDGKEKYHLTEWGKSDSEIIKWLEKNRTPSLEECEPLTEEQLNRFAAGAIKLFEHLQLHRKPFPDLCPMDGPKGIPFAMNIVKSQFICDDLR